MSRTILLLRHSECIANERDLVCGVGNSPLSARGAESLKSAGRYKLSSEWSLFSSPLSRCVETTASLFNREFEILEYLVEVDYGILEGRAKHEVEVELSEFGLRWDGLATSSVEKYRSAARDLLSRPENNILAVTHGGFINFVVAEAMSIPDARFPFLRIDNLHVSCLVENQNGSWVMKFSNRDVSCLNEYFG
ncbi:histidine phosphatase family protein [Uliginosibacterium sp. 31-12]|uniref:histidine phosphatase family protein n=1 Tax=Uliginosibacterium sp. 31-12 TaxID=3062781 RepID=UPI0026E26325|nr:histidine phosphatase family protein [Uliginosibacterium sp. 31-12]MDO6388171.1 histidine phosphatase family protein [Uliginosibacterium sp. 31-12]